MDTAIINAAISILPVPASDRILKAERSILLGGLAVRQRQGQEAERTS